MGMLTWKQAVSDYDEKKAGSAAASTPTSGMPSWKQAADEFDRYDEDGYKALGQQRMAQMQERYRLQKDSISGLERLHADDTVNDWLNRYNRVIQGITRIEQKRNGGFTHDADSVYEAEIDALLSGYDGIKNHSEIRQYYDSLTELKNSLSAINESMAQFEDENAFDHYMAYWKDQEEKKNLDLDAYSRETAALEKQLADYAPEFDWTDNQQRDAVDAEIQRMQDEINRRKMYLADAKKQQEKARYESYRGEPDFMQRAQSGLKAFEDGKLKDREEESWFEAIGRYLGKTSDTTMALGDTGRMAQEYRKDTNYKEPADNWTQDEQNMFGYLYSIDPEAAADYAVKTSEDRRRAENQQKIGAVQEWATKNGVNASAGTVADIAMMPLSLADTLNALTEYNARGTISTPSSPTPGQVSEAITGAVGQSLNEKHGTISEKIPVIGGKGWGDAYQLGTSIANSLLSVYTQGSMGTDILFFGSAASSTMTNAKDRGATDEQAIKLGILSGLAEAAGEHFSINGLIGMSEANTMKAFFGNVLKQSGIEASEEGFTTLMNNFADQLIMGKDSTFYEKVRVYMSEKGMTMQEAKKQAWKDMAEDLAFDMVGGAISGGVSTGIQTGAQKMFAGTQQAQTHHEPLATELANSEENATADNAEAVTEESSAVDNKMSATENAPTLETLSEKYGDRAADMRKTFMEGQDIEEYDRAFQMAYDMGKAGVNESYAQQSEATAYLSETQRSIAYNMGVLDAQSAASAQAARNAAAANGKTGWHKGTVKGQDVKIADMAKAFNDPQRKAYKYLTNIAEVTGVDIVLYKSETDADGNYQGAQGKFKWNENTIYIDINAGLDHYANADQMAKYTMMRTFDHEFTHFIEKWNPEEYNSFRSLVFETMESNGTNVEDAIELMMEKTGNALTYDQASREVIAEAMTDILPETSFIEQLARKNQNVFQQLLSKLKEFLTSLKSHFAAMGDSTKEAKTLKKQMGETVSYMEDIVKKFDAISVKAVENYQRTVAEDATVFKEEKVVSKKEKTTETKPAETVTEETVSETEDTVSGTEETVSETEDTVSGTEESVIESSKVVSEVGKVASEDASLDASPASATEEYRSEHGYTIRPNEQYGSLEITFDGKPSQAVRDALKANKFRWNGKKGVWYGKTDQKTIVDALDKAYQPKASDPVDLSQKPMERTGDTMTIGDPAKATHEVEVTLSDEEYEALMQAVPEKQEATEPAPATEAAQEIPTKTETEEAKQELRKAVRMPIQGTNAEALLQGIKSKELSMESIILSGSVDGFNDQQRHHLVSRLLEGVYTDSEVIKIDVPYDGKFEIVNTPGNVAKVLENLKVRVNQEAMFDKKTISLLTSNGDVRIVELDGQKYLSNSYVMIPATDTGVEYIKEEFNGKEMTLHPPVEEAFQRADKPLTEAPTEAKLGKTNVLIFRIDGKQLYFDKRYFAPLDGGQLLYAEINGAGILKSVDASGNVLGYLMGIKPGKDSKITNEKPSNLKSYQKKKGTGITAPKSAEKTTPVATEAAAPVPEEKPDIIQYQRRPGEIRRFSYEWFTSKPDMAITEVERVGKVNTRELRSQIIEKAMENAKSVGTVNELGNPVVHVKDTGTDVVISKTGIRHSMDRRADVVGSVAVKIGDILSNAVLMNELNPRSENITDSYILIGAAKNKTNEPYIVSFVVNRYTSEVTDIDVLYAVNAKKEPAGSNSPSITVKNTGYFTGSTVTISNLLDFVNQYFPDTMPEDVLKHYGHDRRPDGTLGQDALYQQRYGTLTDRDILDLAANDLSTEDMTEAERGALEIFRDRLAKLDDLQEQRAQLGRTYKDQQFGQNVNREAAALTLEKMHVLDERIKEANSKVLDVEEKTVLRDVLKKARKVVEQAQKDHDQEILKRWRDRRNNAASIKKYQQRIAKDVKALSDWVIHPDNKDVVKHVPDVLKNAVIPFLTGIDFTSKRQLRGGSATKADAEFVKRLEKLQAALKTNIDETGLYSGYNDLPPQFMEKLQGFINAVKNLTAANSGEFVVNRMTSDELKALSEIVGTLKKLIQDCNKFHYNSMYHHVWEAGDATIDSLSQYKDAKSRSKAGETVDNFLFWQQIRPAYAWERFGQGGKAIYDGLRRGQAQLAFNTQRVVDFSNKTYTEEEVRDWEKEVKIIELDDGSTIRVKTAQAMSFYELSKDKDSLRHILGQGIRVATYHAGREKVSDTGHLMSIEDVGKIIDSLTPRQKEVADSLQKFMADQGAKWGNYVSVKRFGEELFGNPTYFPINSDGRHLQATTDEMPESASLYALLNMGFTKARNEKANNRIVLYSIFDVFANHMASMAQYNALSLPVLDALKWFNYQQKEDVVTQENGKEVVKHTVKDGVRDELNRVYGVAEETRPGSGRRGYAENFITGILKAFNGTEAQGIPTDESGLKLRHRYNMAQVAFNLRVVAQQPLAITRAGMLISYKSILRGMKLNPEAIRKNIAEMQKHSGIAAWKGLGFYDINISRGLTDIIKHKESWREKVNEAGMWGAEQADQLTWAGIWSACKEEILRRGMKYGEAGFFDAVSELFEEVIYKTQVVDSVLTKNEYMRSKGFWARTTSSFMSEPVTSASMLIDAYDKLQMDMQKGMDFSQAWRQNKGRIGRTAYVYGMGAAVLAAVTAVMDAFRDDDEYETFLEKWSEAFSGNLIDELNPLGKLPLVKEVSEFVKELAAAGWKMDVYGQMSNLPYIDMAEQFIKGVEILSDKINAVDTNYTWYGGIYKLLQGISGISGLPMAATTREIITIWNNTVGRMAPSYKVKTYDAGEKSNIKYAYQDGYLTEEEAMQELLDKGLSDNENEAYWLIRKWDSGTDSFSRYDAIDEAVRSGNSINTEMGELTSHGYTEEDVRSHIKTSIGKWYQEGTITKQQAMDMLKKYSSLNRNEITEIVNRWSSKVVTGIAFDDIKEQFMSGDLSQSKAAEMYVRYGGYTKEKAAETVSVWAFVKKHPECDGITSHAVADYTTYCEKAGVPAKTFYQAWKHKNTLSGTVKAPMMEYINGLNLSRSQKDSLYYAFGWAESTIDEVPWH